MKILDYFTNDIGIDLGTANTLIYVKNHGIVLNEPSIVAVSEESNELLAIGDEAKRMIGRTPKSIRIVRPMRNGVIADFEMTEEMLREFIKRVMRRKFLVKPRIVISVPSGITEVEKRAVADTAENAGARDVFLVKEPMAAAIGVGLPIDEACGNMIMDIGGGTSEIAVISLSGIVNNISLRIAGDELNKAIVDYMKDEYNLLIGEQTAEKVKIEIGSAYELPHEKDMEVKGRGLITGIPKTVNITSQEVREALKETNDNMINAAKEGLEATPPELAADIIDRGIIMTGGSALIKGLDERMRQETNLSVYVVDDPLKCVVHGTGKIINNFSEYSNILIREKSIAQ